MMCENAGKVRKETIFAEVHNLSLKWQSWAEHSIAAKLTLIRTIACKALHLEKLPAALLIFHSAPRLKGES